MVDAQAFTLQSLEQVIYDGEAGGDALTVITPAGVDAITYTPGATTDSAAVQVGNLLPLAFTALGAGTVTLADTSGGRVDDLMYVGSGLDDSFAAAPTTGAVTLNSQLPVATPGVNNLILDGADGNDNFTVTLPQPYTSITTRGGGPGNSDTLLVIDELFANDSFELSPGFNPGDGSINVNASTTFVNYAGVEHVVFLASFDVDTLLINDDLADNAWQVIAGPTFGDRVQIDDRESIDFSGFASVELRNLFGTDVFRVHPTDLTGANTLTVTGDGEDVLEAIGAPPSTDTGIAIAVTENTSSPSRPVRSSCDNPPN